MINVNLLYPVGSIYISVNSKNPSEIFGGTWERIKGKMLLGVDEDDQDFSTSGKTGGEKTHILTLNEMPSHQHTISNYSPSGRDTSHHTVEALDKKGYTANILTNEEGGDQAHNNMPPYFTCYIWYRTA